MIHYIDLLTFDVCVDVVCLEPPRFLVYINSIDADIGDNATFYCKAQACPVADIFWYKSGQQLRNSEQYQIKYKEHGVDSESMLIVLDVTVECEGTYQVKAKNHLGMDYCEADLNVYDGSKLGAIVI